MNERLCLEWCLEYGHRFPQDYRTALHVRDWLADKAAWWAQTECERAAVDAARSAAAKILEKTNGRGY